MVTFALIGKGSWGKNYIKTIEGLSSCILPSNFIKTRDYKSLLNYKNIDGVIIATPAATHFEIAKEFLEKGFNVLIEKPFVTNYKEAKILAEIVKEKKNIVMIGHLHLYNPAFLKVKSLVNKVGKIKYVASEGMDYGPVRSDISSLWDWAPHDVSMTIDLLGDLPKEVSGYGLSLLHPNTRLYDVCYLKLKFPKDIFVFINVSWLSKVKKRNMTIVGEEATLIFDDTIEKKISLIKNFKKTKKVIFPFFSKELPLTAEVLRFVDLIKNKGRKRVLSLNMGLNVVRVLEACEKSIQGNGKTIKI